MPTIVAATILPPAGWGDMAKVTAIMSDGTSVEVFKYFDDELRFSSSEFVGLTIDQACALKLRRDVAYLQS